MSKRKNKNALVGYLEGTTSNIEHAQNKEWTHTKKLAVASNVIPVSILIRRRVRIEVLTLIRRRVSIQVLTPIRRRTRIEVLTLIKRRASIGTDSDKKACY